MKKIWLLYGVSILICCVAFGMDDDLNSRGEPKRNSEVWGLGSSGAALVHGVGCMCMGCQEELAREEEEEARVRARKEAANEEANARRLRASWDAQLKEMGVESWSYEVQTQYMSPRVKATIVLRDGRRVDLNQKFKRASQAPSPVQILLAQYPELAQQTATSGNTSSKSADSYLEKQIAELQPTPYTGGVDRAGWCKYCGMKLMGNFRICSRCKMRKPDKYIQWQNREAIKAQRLRALMHRE